MSRITMSLLLLLLSTSAAGQEFNYDAYKPAALTQIAASHPAQSADWFAEGHPRYRTRVTFSGHVRPMAEDLRKFVGCWVKAMGHPAAYADIFQQEIEVSQDGVSYWMPVEDVLVEQLQAEVLPGAEVDLYLLLMGGRRDRIVLAVSEFDAVADAHATAQSEHN